MTGGWYDAGDHGKYVVNGGISAWTMLNQYERALAKGTAGDFGDGKLNIPEKKNKVPDILDEARVEMEFMLKMQVPDGKPKAGMVHHKIHDKAWTALGMCPAPGRAAALPLAAVDGGDAEPGGDGGAVRAHLAEARQEVRRPLPGGRGEGLGGGAREPGDLRRHVGGRRRAVRRQGRQRRVLLGGGGAVRDDQEGRVQGGRSRSRRTTRRS